MRLSSVVAASISIAVAAVFLLVCQKASNPFDPSKADISLVLTSSAGVTSESSITDTVGDTVTIGLILHLAQHIDSTELSVHKGDSLEYFFICKEKSQQVDTIEYKVIFASAGDRSVTATAYVKDELNPQASATIHIFDRPTPNRAPQWESDTVYLSGQPGSAITLSLADKCSDPDGDTLTYALLSGSPAGDTVVDSSWTFTPAAGDTGRFLPQVIARDPDGASDTMTIVLTITAEDSTPPTMRLMDPSQDSMTVASPTYQVRVSCKDASGIASVTCSMEGTDFPVSGSDTLYSATVTGLSPSVMNTIMFTAEDASPAANRCTLYVHLLYDSTITDNVPPVITLVSPGKDTVIAADSCGLRVKCTDASGIASVSITAGGSTFPATQESDSVYTATIRDLAAGQYTTVTITATDNSSASNSGSNSVRIKYDNDRTGPSLALVSPEQGSSVATSSVTVQISCSDASGIASIICTLEAASFSVTRSSTVDTLYSTVITGLVADQFNRIRFVATDSSLSANRDSLIVSIKYDNDRTKPSIRLHTPSRDSTSINASSVNVKMICTDASGIAAVSCVMSGNTFTTSGTPGDSVWSANISGLVANQFNAISMIATDSSLAANKDTLVFRIKYDPTMEDSAGPTIWQKSGPTSGTIVSSPFITIIDSVADPSGIDSVYWTLNNGPKKMLSAVSGQPGQYSLTDTLPHENLDTIVVTAVDGSTRHNRSTQTIVLNYIIAPRITSQPVSQSVCAGSAAIFSVTATGTAPLSYQWRRGAGTFTNIPGATSPSCTLSSVTNTDNGAILSCLVNNGSPNTAASNLCTLTVNTISTKPTATATPASVCPGGSSVLSVSAGTLGTDASWKWYTSKTGTALTSNTVSPSTATWYFVRGEGTCGNSAWDSVRITMNTVSTKPTPVATPSTVCQGKSSTLSISSGTLGTGATWNWYTSTTGTPFSTSASPTVTPQYLTRYYVRGVGTCGNSAWDSVQVYVDASPSITTQPPAKDSLCYNSTTGLYIPVVASGSGLTYQWYRNGAVLSDDMVFGGTTTATLYLKGLNSSDRSGSYYCIITNAAGCSVISTTTVVTMRTDC
ncbi:MAG: hypothetical protein JXA71_19715 [Chitinispirillaceae bacterium]|nr:hypothetical protein [Chitinispirillaceae bacterium]